VLARPGFVGAAPALPGASRLRLPPASPPCCDRASGEGLSPPLESSAPHGARGYCLTAAATDHRIKAVGTVSAVDIARQFRQGADGTQNPAVIQGMLDAAAAARTAEACGEGVRTFKLFPDTEQEARQGGPHVYEGWEYYCTPRAYHPRSAKALTWSSIDHMAFFDAFRFVSLIGQRPLLMIVGRAAVTSWMSIQAFQNATGPKELHWINGASHNDLYDKEQYVGPAVTKLTGFFTKNLASDTTPAEAASA
jgi:fermentation-respiration switch protein FrsA (DUF1100 family)